MRAVSLRNRSFAVGDIGKKFGRLLVVSAVWNDGKAFFNCLCDCGKECLVRRKYVVKGETHSCGCLKTEVLLKRSTKHGKSQTSTYRIWNDMQRRCADPRVKNYANYGGRGIAVCERWTSEIGFENFVADMGERPASRSLDRIDNDGPYSPENCRWATVEQQQRNTRQNRILHHQGTSMTMVEWSERLGLKYANLQGFVHRHGPNLAIAVMIQRINKRAKKCFI